MTDIFYTVHAQKSMAERGVTHDEVAAVILKPDTTYRGNSDRPDVKVYQGGSIGVVVLPQRDGSFLVITVLWRTSDTWTSDQMRDKR